MGLKASLTCALLMTVSLLNAQPYASSYDKKLFFANGEPLAYRVFYPASYDTAKKYPLVIFLHGSGERGSDNQSQLMHGAGLFANPFNQAKYPAVVIFPQCPSNDTWFRYKISSAKDSLKGLDFASNQPMTKSLNALSLLLDSLANDKSIDNKRIYLGGLSMGGLGTFELLWRKPGFFAAAFPICGGGDPTKVKLYGPNFPIWIFHGDKDEMVSVSQSRRMVNALKKSGAKIKYSEYPGVGHDSWNNAFVEPELLEWMFSQRKEQ